MISQMCQHIQSVTSFGIISPFKRDLTDIENNDRLTKLKKMVRSAGFGSIILIGEFEKDGKLIQEKSIFIPNLNKSNILKWGKFFEQFSVIYKDNCQFAEIGCSEITGLDDVKTDYYKKGWSREIDFKSSLASEFFIQIAKGSHRQSIQSSTFTSFTLKEIIPLTFNERAYHGKKNGDETFINLLV